MLLSPRQTTPASVPILAHTQPGVKRLPRLVHDVESTGDQHGCLLRRSHSSTLDALNDFGSLSGMAFVRPWHGWHGSGQCREASGSSSALCLMVISKAQALPRWEPARC